VTSALSRLARSGTIQSRRAATGRTTVDGSTPASEQRCEATPPSRARRHETGTVRERLSERVNADTASQQLGHSSPAIAREFYIAKPAIAADVAHVLQELADKA
jgi:hypothetical protein